MNHKYLHWHNKKDIQTLIKALKQGNSAVGTSDTVIGLMAPLTLQGFNALNRIKGRSKNPYLILMPSEFHIEKFTNGVNLKKIKNLMAAFWPGPLTIIMQAKESVPFFWQSERGTIALRVPNHQGLQEVAHALGGIFSTSANKTGDDIPKTIKEIDASILNYVTYIVDGYDQAGVKPSTIVDCTGKACFIVREGAIANECIQAILNDV